MKWILMVWLVNGGFQLPIEMPSKEVCLKAAKSIDDQSVSIWSGCLNKESGEFVIND